MGARMLVPAIADTGAGAGSSVRLRFETRWLHRHFTEPSHAALHVVPCHCYKQCCHQQTTQQLQMARRTCAPHHIACGPLHTSPCRAPALLAAAACLHRVVHEAHKLVAKAVGRAAAQHRAVVPAPHGCACCCLRLCAGCRLAPAALLVHPHQAVVVVQELSCGAGVGGAQVEHGARAHLRSRAQMWATQIGLGMA